MSYSPFALKNAPAQTKAFAQDLNVKLVCPDCQDAENGTLIEEFGSGDLLCGQCGLVLGDRIVDTRSEWRSFADSEGDDPSRVGGPTDPLLDSSEQFATVISFKDGNTGVAKSLQQASRLVGRDGKGGAGKDRTEAYRDLATLCEAISLPRSIIDTSKQLFKRVDEEKLLRGKSQDAIVAACIFIACRQGRVPRTFKEIVALSNVPKSAIAACFKIIEKTLDTIAPGSNGPPTSSSNDSLITRYCNHLGLSVPTQRAAVHVINQASEIGILDGRSPITVAAACIMFVTALWGINKNAKNISDVAGVNETTIKAAYKLLYAEKEKLIDEKWFDPTRAVGMRAYWHNLTPQGA